MKKGDVLLKKWCFGISYKKIYDRVEVHNGEASVVMSYPKYRSIALRVLSATKKGKNSWEIEAEQFASITAKPKKIKTVIKKAKNGQFVIDGQKKGYHKLDVPPVLSDKMPPVGSIVTLNKRHALVTGVGRNEMTIFLDNKYLTVSAKPGTIKWRKDNIIASMPVEG
tara:strand:- start:3402 stop:3902 length:501 start_codon:yes stop_codon:yes gene_type:complete